MDQAMEHLGGIVCVMRKLHRILKPGGIAEIHAPYARSDWAFQDSTHKQFFTERSLDYFTSTSECNLCSGARFRILKSGLTPGKHNFHNRLRDLPPLGGILRHFFWNMYDGANFRLECQKGG